MATVLAIDDDPSILFLFQTTLSEVGHDVMTAASVAEGVQRCRDVNPDVVLLDLGLPDQSGLELLKKIREVDKRTPVIVVTGDADAETAIEAISLGAYDYVAKPVDVRNLRELVDRAVRLRETMRTQVALGISEDPVADAFVGRSPAMLEVFKKIGRCAAQKIPVLIRGESGTGKELVARAIYQHSDRSTESYIAINCAALKGELLESELFGHEKGAFTSADRRRIGKFEQCSGGTIFLDEIGDMALPVQAKMLRLLQEQRFERVGGNETITTDVRILAATNRALEAMVESGSFRADLLFRLNGVPIHLAPLKERGEDINRLIKYFLGQASREMNVEIEGVAPETLQRLTDYPWPGNVRELQSVLRQTALNANGPVIAPEHLPPEILSYRAPPLEEGQNVSITGGAADDAARTNGEPVESNGEAAVSGARLDVAAFVRERLNAGEKDLSAKTIEATERVLYKMVLEETRGNQTKASEILGVTRGTIRDRIQAFEIVVDRAGPFE